CRKKVKNAGDWRAERSRHRCAAGLENVRARDARARRCEVLGGAPRDGGAHRSIRLRQIDAPSRAGGLVAIDKTLAPSAQPRAGTIAIFGRPMQRDGRIARGAKELRVRVGVIFQQFNLVPRLSVLTNVCLGLLGRMPFVRGTLSNFTM